MAVQIQLRRSTASEWTAANPLLAQGEIGIELDTNKFKIGTGLTSWNNLSYALSNTVIPVATSSVTGVASFGNEFVVSPAGSVSLTGNYVRTFNGLTGDITLAQGTNITLVPVGNTITVNSTAVTNLPLATSSITGVASFNSNHFSVSSTGSVSITGPYFVFDSDLTAAFGAGKFFGKYANGDTIPAKGKTPVEVIKDALIANLPPTVNLSSATTIQFNQTAISNVLSLSYTINTLGATGSTANLGWKRTNESSYTTLPLSTLTPTAYTHTYTDTAFNTLGFDYRYLVTDSAGATNQALLTITPAAYSAPTVAFSITGPSANTAPETPAGATRIRGNVKSDISQTTTRNSPLVPIEWWGWYYEENQSGTYVAIGATFDVTALSPPLTGATTHSVSTSANYFRYRVKVKDAYTTTDRNSSLYELRHVVYWGKSASASPTSINDLTTGSNRRFTSSQTALGTYTYTFPTSVSAEFSYVIVPTSPGSPGSYSSWLDINNLSVSPDTGTFTENNEYGINIGWRWYKVSNATTSTYQITAS